jgi:hypothetical protein
METLQILGWIYLGLSIGSIGGFMALGLFQSKRITSLEEKSMIYNFKNKILEG